MSDRTLLIPALTHEFWAKGRRFKRAAPKWFRNLAISKIVSETLESLKMKFPEPTVDIDEIKKKYHAIVEADEQKGGEKRKKKKKKK